MAVFDKTSELDRQGKTIAPEIVKGAKGVAMKAVGYDPTTGQENTWGKFFHAVPGMSTWSNLMAGGLSKGTDVNDVIKEGRDEAMAYDLNKLALGVDVFKMAAAPGIGGLTGAGFSNQLASSIAGNSLDMLNGQLSNDPSSGINSVSQSDFDNLNKYNRTMNTISNVGGVANSLARTIQGGMAYNDELQDASKGLYKQSNDPFSYL